MIEEETGLTIFLCEGGFYGILSGVYEVYASRLGLENCRLELKEEYEPRLFADYRELDLHVELAEKVARTVRERMSEDAFVWVYRSSLHKNTDRADWILRFIELGLSCGRNVLNRMQHPAVYEIFAMNRYVWNEAHLLTGFVRFKKLPDGLFYGRIGPENDCLEIVAGHFADRLSGEKWILYDEKRKKAAFHSPDGRWAVMDHMEDSVMERMSEQAEADVFADMWNAFFHSIAITERTNPRCQRSFLPLRYRKYMTEFQQTNAENSRT